MSDTPETLERLLRDTLRNVQAGRPETPDPTPSGLENLERFRLYRLCPCDSCAGSGKRQWIAETADGERLMTGRPLKCEACRGEGRSLDLVATCATPEAVGVALITLGREGEWAECPVGVLDTLGEKGEKWIVTPWLPSARNVSDAGKLLRKQQT